jgi:glycine/D-amino acid oxidase-like deaminating enzyme
MDRPGVVFDDQARIEPQRYIRALIDRIAVEGGYVFEDSPVIEILDDPVRVVCGAHVIRCRDVVLATDAPVLRQSRPAAAPVRQPPICRRPNRAVVARVPPGWLPDAFFRDTAAPSRQLRVQPGADSDLVVYGGADSRGASGLDSRLRFEHLADELRRVVPEADVLDGWSGLVSTPADGLPLIGYTAPHRFAMTGFDGNALTLGTLAGLMAWDALRGRRNPWQYLFDPARTGVRRGAWDYSKENADHAYYLVRDWVATAADQPTGGEAPNRSFQAAPVAALIGAS